MDAGMYRRDLRDTSADRLLADMAVADMAQQAVPEPDGDRIAYATTREDRTDLWIADGEGPPRRLTSEGTIAMRYTHVDTRWFDWHPDGEAIAYATPDREVWTVDTETGEKTKVTAEESAGDPRFGPGGDEIALVTDRGSPGSLAVASADGGRIEVVRDDEYMYVDPRWNGDTIYAVRTRHRDLQDLRNQIVRVGRDGDVETVFAEEDVNAFAPRPRPDADGLALVHDASGYDALYLRRGGETDELFAPSETDVGAPSWHPSGDRLAVTAVHEGDTQIYTVSLDGEAERVTERPGDRYFPEFHGDDLLVVHADPTTPPEVRNLATGGTVAGGAPIGLEERLIDPESMAYESAGGLEIHAMVYLPRGIDDAGADSVPLLVHPHGGPTAYDGYEYNYRAQYFVDQGYAVIEPNYRGSSGFGREFRNLNDRAWGEGDLRDVINAADALADYHPAVDGDRAGIFGGSGGGLMTVNALGRSDRFLAGAAFYGVYDYETFMDDTDDVGWRLMKRELGFPSTDVENYRDASPIRAAGDIEAPLLLLHGEEDARVPISQSEQLAEELEKHGKRYELRRYAGEPHGFTRRENVIDAYSRVADLFAKYLQVDPDDGTSRPYEPPEDS